MTWDGLVGLFPFGSTTLTLVTSDTSVASPNSEAFFMTAKDAGTYFVRVTVPTGGTTFGTYRLSASVLPAPVQSSTTYTSAAVPVTIIDAGVTTSTITIPDDKRIGKLRSSSI